MLDRPDAWQLHQLTRGTGDWWLFHELVEQIGERPYLTDAQLLQHALEEQAAEDAAWLRDHGALFTDEDFEWDDASRARYQELRSRLEQMQLRAYGHPVYADALVVQLGGAGTHGVLESIRTSHQQVADMRGTGDADVVGDLLRPFADIVAVATRDGGVPDRVVHQLVSPPGMPGGDGRAAENLALLLSVGSFHERFLGPAFDHVWAHHDRTFAHLSSIFIETMDGEVLVGATLGLSRNPDLAFDKLTADGELRDVILQGDVFDHSPLREAAARDLLIAAFHTNVARDLERGDTSSYDATKGLLEGWVQGVVDDDINMNDGQRDGVATIATLYFDLIARDAGLRDVQPGALKGVERQELVDFYDDLFESEAAQRISAAGWATFAASRYGEGADLTVATVQDGHIPWQEFNTAAEDVGELGSLLTEALEQDTDDAREHQAFMNAFTQTLAKTALGVTVALTIPASGGASAVLLTGAVRGGGELLFGQVLDGGEPSFDSGAHLRDQELMAELVMTGVILEHPELYAGTELDGGSDDDVERLRALARQALAGDGQAVTDLDGVLRSDYPSLRNRILEATEHTSIGLAFDVHDDD